MTTNYRVNYLIMHENHRCEVTKVPIIPAALGIGRWRRQESGHQQTQQLHTKLQPVTQPYTQHITHNTTQHITQTYTQHMTQQDTTHKITLPYTQHITQDITHCIAIEVNHLKMVYGRHYAFKYKTILCFSSPLQNQKKKTE